MYRKVLTIVISGLIASMLSFGAFAAKVNLNTADAQELAEGIDGVGPKLAEAIVKWREANGSFSSIEQLVEIKGVGPNILEKNRENLIVDASSQ
ncbi:MAG: hypothetical protein DHS20C01_15540 [marine bacterium B5-7]|nr:MAG: hypothetical protein DHS20C01_15540 [marine bacterium B5-7]